MQQLKILNKKETKELLNSVEKQWGAKLELESAFLKNQKDRIFLITKDLSKIDLSNLRTNSIGLYFCDIAKGIRLSIEGSQIIGKKATKNIVEIEKEQVKLWMRGEDLEIEGDYSGFVILKNKNDFLGCGKFKDNKVLNYVSKERRVNVI